MRRFHIIGGKNHGKTTLMVDLVEQFTRRGLRVGTIKHTHHRHELDMPGKDSQRHRQAGGNPAGIISHSVCALFWPRQEDEADRYAAFDTAMAGCDLVLVEGDSQTTAPKIEVWRADLETDPLAESDPTILAIVTDDDVRLDAPVLRRSDVSGLAEWIYDRLFAHT